MRSNCSQNVKHWKFKSKIGIFWCFGVYILSLNKDLHWGVVMAGSSGTSRIPPCLPGYLTDTVLEDKQVWSIPYQLFSLFVLWPVASGWARCDYTLSGGLIYIYYLLSHKDSPTGVFNNPAAQHSLRCYHQIQCWLGHTEYGYCVKTACLGKSAFARDYEEPCCTRCLTRLPKLWLNCG